MSDTNTLTILRTSIDRACHFLEKSQWPGGFWIDFELEVGMSSQWVTAYLAHCLSQANGSQNAISKARDWLIKTQFDEGGWGFNRHVPPDADSIAIVLLLLSSSNHEDVNYLHQIAEFLITFQSNYDCGFITYHPRPKHYSEEQVEFLYEGSNWCTSHLSVTALALEALLSVSKTKYKMVIQSAADFIRAHQTQQGYWNSYWWYGPMYSTYRAARTLALSGDESGSYRAALWLADTCQNDGGWGNYLHGSTAPFFTALATSTLLLFPENTAFQQFVQQGISWLLDTQRDDGSWESVPMLLSPVPQVRVPWEEKDPSCSAAVPDQNRLFTTATVLSTLAAYRDSFSL